jgi:hypothetical protein
MSFRRWLSRYKQSPIVAATGGLSTKLIAAPRKPHSRLVAAGWKESPESFENTRRCRGTAVASFGIALPPKESIVSHHLDHGHSISRREFTVEWALAMLAGVAITISGCGSDSPSSPTPSPGGGGGGGTASGDVSGAISANHGHIATVTAARINAAAGFDLDIMGNATHPHTVTLSASQVQQIGTRQTVAVTSTTNESHNHTVTFN